MSAKLRPNEPCPCGSGKKYKKCHGAASAPGRPISGTKEWCARGRALQAAGRLEEAEACYQQSLRLSPADADTWLALGGLAEQVGDSDTARACYARLVALHPDHAPGHAALGDAHARAFDFDQARRCYRRALELNPKLAGVWWNLGNVEKYAGDIQTALDCYRKGVELEPDPAVRMRRHGNLLIALHYDDSLSHEAIFQAHRDWAERYARPHYPHAPSWPNAADPERSLRIGYLSGSLNGLIVGHFLLNVLCNHDRQGYGIHVYSSATIVDEFTGRLRQCCDEWVDIAALGDAAAAARIRTDGIDILVDLDGHSPAGRPLILARRPAPVQVEWLDCFDTSGMAVVDYLLTDPYTTPLDSPQRFTEMPCRLPHTRLCYTPPEYAPPVAPAPSNSGRPFTFGSFNRQDKLGPELLARWAAILLAVPESRLLLKNRGLQVPALRDAVGRRFVEQGIDPDRIELRGPSSHADMLAEYAEIDIALDPYPYNGGLTSCECLWMGVPIVALEGERMIGRQTAALLHLLGLPDWSAATPDDYVLLAIEKSRDPAALEALRKTMRPRMAAAPICDAPRFACDLENAYRDMWRRYCRQA